MKNINDTLKILTGRKLSAKQMEKVKLGEQRKETPFLLHLEDSKKIEIMRLLNDGRIISITESYEFAVTKDVSDPSVYHEGYYLIGLDEKIYNSKGLLEKRIIEKKNRPMSPFCDCTTLVYNPAGSFFGRINKN